MKKTFSFLTAVFVLLCLFVSCSQNVELNDVNDNVKIVESLQTDFKTSLKTAIDRMPEDAKPLLNSVVFDEKDLNIAVRSGGVYQDDVEDNELNDDEIFENLSEEEKAQIQKIAEKYFEEVQDLAKNIVVFDKGLPEGVEETDLFVKYAGIEYSKCVPETLEMAYQIRDELYNGDIKSKGAKLWVTPRWKLIGAPLGAIFYSYKSDFTKEEKVAIRHAMDEWEEKTDGAVRFYERPLNWWGLVKWGLGITRNVRIEKVSSKIYSGEAMPGNMPWSYLRLSINYVFDGDYYSDRTMWQDKSSWTHSTLIHELGHVIGLQHEFERSDRDSYLEANENSFPGPCGFLRWLQSWNIKNYGTYDYKSCMNYCDYYKIKGTDRLIRFEDINEISHNDVLTVKYIYSCISYNDMITNWLDTKVLLLEEY